MKFKLRNKIILYQLVWKGLQSHFYGFGTPCNQSQGYYLQMEKTLTVVMLLRRGRPAIITPRATLMTHLGGHKRTLNNI